MKTRIIRLISILALLVFAFSLTACSEMTDEEIETIKYLMDANDISTEQLRAIELTPEVKEVICDIIADECEKKGVEIDRDVLKSMDLDFTALADYKIEEENLKEFKENMNWDPAITKEILDNMGVDEQEVNASLADTGLTEDELLVLLKAVNEPDVEGAADVLADPDVRQIDINLHIDIPQLGIKLDRVPVGDIVDTYEEGIMIANDAGGVLRSFGVPVKDVREYLTPPTININAADVIAALEPVGAVAKNVSENIDPTIIQDVVEGKEIDPLKLFPPDGYGKVIAEAQQYVYDLVDQSVPPEVAKFIGILLAVDHNN